MRTRIHRTVVLRGTSEVDLRLLHAMERGPASNAPAGTKPREWAAFHAPWLEILGDRDGSRTGVTPRVVLEEGHPAGSVDLALQAGLDTLGYWIAREHWGRGIASAAVGLMLAEFARRPLYAAAAASNAPSIRVLERHWFTLPSRVATPETARTVERETATLVLR